MKPIECTSDYIYFTKQDELYLNSVSYERFSKSPDAQELASLRIKGWYNVELALGSDLGNNYDPDSWYIVKGHINMKRINAKIPRGVETYEALISF